MPLFLAVLASTKAPGLYKKKKAEENSREVPFTPDIHYEKLSYVIPLLLRRKAVFCCCVGC